MYTLGDSAHSCITLSVFLVDNENLTGLGVGGLDIGGSDYEEGVHLVCLWKDSLEETSKTDRSEYSAELEGLRELTPFYRRALQSRRQSSHVDASPLLSPPSWKNILSYIPLCGTPNLTSLCLSSPVNLRMR